MKNQEIAAVIESTLLKPDVSIQAIHAMCEEAQMLGVKGVCIPPYFVKEASRKLENSAVIVVSVVGFPYGYSHTTAKVEEVKKMVHDGAEEVDMVVNVAAVKDRNWGYVENDIAAVTQITHLKNCPIKLIIEIGLMSPDEIRRLCELAVKCKVDFVKTSTGVMAPGPAVEDIRFLRSILPASTGIKASAGIRTLDHARDLILAGANRIGTSSAAAILENIS